MGTRKASFSDSNLGLLDHAAVGGNLYRKLVSFVSSWLCFVAGSILFCFRFIAEHVFRLKKNRGTRGSAERKEALKLEEKRGDFMDEGIEKRIPILSFKFQHQTSVDQPKIEEVSVQEEEEEEKEAVKEDRPALTAADIHNYRFLSERDFSMEEPEAMTLRVHESFNGFEDDSSGEGNVDLRFLSAEDFLTPTMAEEIGNTDDDRDFWNKPNSVCSASNSEGGREFRFISEEFSGFDSDTGSSSSDGYSVKELIYDSDIFWEGEADSGNKETSLNCVGKLEQGQSESFFLERSGEEEGDDDDNEVKDLSKEKLSVTVNEQINIKDSSLEKSRAACLPNVNVLQIEFIENSSDEELFSAKKESTRLELQREVEDDSLKNDSKKSINLVQEPEQQKEEHVKKEEVVRKQHKEEPKAQDFDSEDLDELWEHQDLIEQLKMELKKVRAIGLPTILEESESPRTIDDLKPFKLDNKFLPEDPMDELHKFYRSYTERMRKFDILNYQKMYAMGFLQLKHPLQAMGMQRPLFSTILSHISQNIMPFCQKKSRDNPSEKFIKELQCDLETVYVGQTCLSWEFLRWQYERSRELPESDPYRSRPYNHVAGEFQQFQVLVHRFIENESFQGPRLSNYVKQRCVLRNLLQVPVIREDSLKEKTDERKEDYVITSEMLEDIMEETIRVFWEFVKADRHETPVFLKGLIENHVELQDQSDYDFFADVRANLQKKEKKLKDLLKTGNCIVKKFKRPQEDKSNQDLFFSQVDLRLASRVLKMARITSDQLIWCHKKLSKISFSERKVQREPSFLLFPC
ncbi:hypothetical protein AXF42_Ash003291 [Apostasia shenzhenica]|uniref:Uncharacterized protein n=1 Tax=Apostasia shenzhenica TaxID=1088818 RepID=A0A2I0BFT8_9ASPA|nr:hypothetical protein AXF42_Ash003291 [Apostasia shenzhenica]